MSVFKTKGIILKINKPKDKDFLYTLFTHDFGRILVAKKKNSKEKLLDLGYIMNCEVRTKESVDIHRISNIKINSEFNYEGRDFKLIESYLELLNLVLKRTPMGSPLYEVFEILEQVNTYKKIDTVKLSLARLKIFSCLGELDIEHKDITVAKILKFVHTHSMSDILRLTGINTKIENKLKDIEKITS